MRLPVVLFILLLFACSQPKKGSTNYTLVGQLDGATGFRRLPDSIEVSDKIKYLSKHSAGLAIRFKTDAPEIGFKIDLASDEVLSHHTSLSSKGVDLYAMNGSRWQFVGSTMGKTIVGLDSTLKDLIAYLPLHNEVSNIEILVPDGFRIEKGPEFDGKPIVIYGTSITQGSAASRPGMCYTSILSRNLNREVINLGFSGNGFFDPLFAEYLVSCDPSVIVLDCTPNSKPEVIKENLPKLIAKIREKSEAPILLVESITREDAYFKKARFESIVKQNKALLEVYESLNDSMVHYLPGDGLIGDDHEATVDGTHLTDLGAVRYERKVREVLLGLAAVK